MRGREAEQQIIRDLLRRAQRGLGGVVLVEGEPGIGKSLLLHEAIELAAGQGFSLAAGASDQFGQAIPRAPVFGRGSFVSVPTPPQAMKRERVDTWSHDSQQRGQERQRGQHHDQNGRDGSDGHAL